MTPQCYVIVRTWLFAYCAASQMWCLGRFLPVLIGDKIPDGYAYWENYLYHLHIMDEVFAPITSDERADYLAILIEDFLVEFKALYPERPLTPKMHYLIHIPSWIKRYLRVVIAISAHHWGMKGHNLRGVSSLILYHLRQNKVFRGCLYFMGAWP